MNPYAARGPVRTANEVQSPLGQVLARLERLGADADELQMVRDGWDDLDDDWTAEARDQLLRLPDDQLRQMIEDARAEYEHGTTSEEDAAAAERAAEQEAAMVEARGRMGQTVAQLVEWVGDDPARAYAVHTLEGQPDGGQRKTLLEAVETAAAAWAADTVTA